MKTFMILLVMLSTGCTGKPLEILNTNNPDFKVQRLFEVDGCKIYRFVNGGDAHYFTNCSGSTRRTVTCGKVQHSEDDVMGEKNR